jgi:hypothetical protein
MTRGEIIFFIEFLGLIYFFNIAKKIPFNKSNIKGNKRRPPGWATQPTGDEGEKLKKTRTRPSCQACRELGAQSGGDLAKKREVVFASRHGP